MECRGQFFLFGINNKNEKGRPGSRSILPKGRDENYPVCFFLNHVTRLFSFNFTTPNSNQNLLLLKALSVGPERKIERMSANLSLTDSHNSFQFVPVFFFSFFARSLC